MRDATRQKPGVNVLILTAHKSQRTTDGVSSPQQTEPIAWRSYILSSTVDKYSANPCCWNDMRLIKKKVI